MVGTIVGSLFAALVLLTFGSGWPVAAAAAVSLGLAVLAAPKLYALSVVGVTSSALLSSCIGSSDPSSPAIRLIDTLLGCAVAIVFGYLLWPRRPSAEIGLALRQAGAAVTHYLDLAAQPPSNRMNWTAARDTAYRSAHLTRQAAQRALHEPRAVRVEAEAALPSALALERLVDEVTALAAGADSSSHGPSEPEVVNLRQRIRTAAAVSPVGAVAN
jgi:uncharacterized membrane protein YccC